MAGITTAETRRLALEWRAFDGTRAGAACCESYAQHGGQDQTSHDLAITLQLVDESTFDVSAVSAGCAGSLLSLAVDGLLDAAVVEGVGRLEAQKMVVVSSIEMLGLVPAGDHPSVLPEKIASPGGCSKEHSPS
ncbi:putative Pyrroline-5-carboxylate reductase [Seiridium unicorne]|uniref:Pyrroline-5-carboxylate reductase n=1 Tax=Seiridium unicorne TaxID=138068 RepID=A0ABR2VD49_9PEZI